MKKNNIINVNKYFIYTFIIFVSILFTMMIIQWSLYGGRLAFDTTFDDSSYLLDAYSRMKILYVQGFPAFIKHLAAVTPHSPWSTLLAMLGFSLFGVKDWAPYVMNSLLVSAILLFSNRILTSIDIPQRIIFLLSILFIPFMFASVHEFRPDVASAFFTSAAVYCAANGAMNVSQKVALRHARLGGLMMGVAFIVKPSFFVHTGMMCVLASITFIVGRYLHKTNSNCTILTKGIGFWHPPLEFALIAMFIALPYYTLYWSYVLNYFWTNTGGSQGYLWKIKGGFIDVIKYYLIGGPAASMIGVFQLLFILLIIVGVIWRKINKDDNFTTLSLLILATSSLVSMIVGSINNLFFGMTYQFIIFFAAQRELVGLWSCVKYRLSLIIFVIAAVVAQIYFGVRPPLFAGSEMTRQAHSVNDKIVDDLIYNVETDKNISKQYKIFCTVAGDVNKATLLWLSIKKGKNFEFDGHHRSTDFNIFKTSIENSDFILIPSENASGVFQWLPCYSVQPAIKKYMLSNPNMKLVSVVQLSDFGGSGQMLLYKNASRQP